MSFSNKNLPALSEILFLCHQERLVLTLLQERALIKVAQNRSEPQKSQALRDLIFFHLPFIISRAKETHADYPVVSFELMDFVELAILGFIQGVYRFDLSRERVKPLTYIGFWISQVMRDEIKKNGFLIRHPETLRLEGDDSSYKKALRQAAWVIRGLVYLDQDARKEGETIGGMIADPASSDWLETKVLNPRLVREIIERTQLTFREAFVLEHRWLAHYPLTLQQCGSALQISRETVRQAEITVIKKLRQTVARLERGVSKPKL